MNKLSTWYNNDIIKISPFFSPRQSYPFFSRKKVYSYFARWEITDKIEAKKKMARASQSECITLMGHWAKKSTKKFFNNVQDLPEEPLRLSHTHTRWERVKRKWMFGRGENSPHLSLSWGLNAEYATRRENPLFIFLLARKRVLPWRGKSLLWIRWYFVPHCSPIFSSATRVCKKTGRAPKGEWIFHAPSASPQISYTRDELMLPPLPIKCEDGACRLAAEPPHRLSGSFDDRCSTGGMSSGGYFKTANNALL